MKVRSLFTVCAALLLSLAALHTTVRATPFEMLTGYLDQHGLDLPDIMTDTSGMADWIIKPPDFIPNKDDYFVIDVRPDSVYENGHIPGAVRSSLPNLLATAKQADKPIVVVCHTGQGAAFAVVGLRLSGYADARVLAFGMSIWNSDFDVWSSHTSDTAVGHANWVTDSVAAPQSFADPAITTTQTDSAALLAERVQAMLAGGPRMVAGPTVLNAPQDYFINVYWPADTLYKHGYIDGAYNIPNLSIGNGTLANLDPSETIVTYCYTGQTAALVTAYLTVLGYDARFMAFGANGMIYSQLAAGTKWPGASSTQAYETGSPAKMLRAYLDNHDLDITDIFFSAPGQPSWIIPASMVEAAPDSYYIMDIRPDTVYAKGHIPGAVNVKLPFVVDSAANAGSRPIVVACHTGQGAAYAVTALRLSGYATAKSMKWGMSAWSADFDIWTPNTGDAADGHANWNTDPAAAPDTFDFPELSAATNDTAALLAERVAAMLTGGPGKLPASMALASPEDYQINVYWPADSLTSLGHIAGAYNIVGNLSIGGGGLMHLDAGQTVVTYCWTGQMAAALSAYLKVLGYDARFIVFGANAMIYSDLAAGASKWAGPADYDYARDIGGAGMLRAYLDNNDLDITDIYFSAPGQPSWIIPASMVEAAPDSYYIMDIRPDSVYDNGHIPGAVNVKLPFVVDSAANAGSKPIVVACHTGQGAAYAVTALRLSGYANAKSMKWGMSAWNADFDIWSPNTGDAADSHANWNTDAAATPDTFDLPDFSTATNDTAAILQQRVAAMLSGGPGKLPAATALTNPGNYQINVYWPADSLTSLGHIAGAYNIVGNLSIGGGGLVHLDAAQTVVTYCWTGQMAAALSAYLKVLGYDTRFIVFGANAMIYSDLAAGPSKWAGPADYDYVSGSGISQTRVPDKIIPGLRSFPAPMEQNVFFDLPRGNDIRITICNSRGIPVRTLTSLTWDGRNDQGSMVKPGLYLYSATVNGKTKKGRIIKIK